MSLGDSESARSAASSEPGPGIPPDQAKFADGPATGTAPEAPDESALPPPSGLNFRRYRWGFVGLVFALVGLMLGIGSGFQWRALLAARPDLAVVGEDLSPEQVLAGETPAGREPRASRCPPASKARHTWTEEEQTGCRAEWTDKLMLRNHKRWFYVGWGTALAGALVAALGFSFPRKDYGQL